MSPQAVCTTKRGVWPSAPTCRNGMNSEPVATPRPVPMIIPMAIRNTCSKISSPKSWPIDKPIARNMPICNRRLSKDRNE